MKRKSFDASNVEFQVRILGGLLDNKHKSERGEVWSSRPAGGREITGSNPVVPTEAEHIRVWGNLGTRVAWDHEIVGSNPITRTPI